MYGVQQIYDQLRSTNASIDLQIAELKRMAERNEVDVHILKDANASLMLAPLLVAKASCLNGMASLKAAELRNRK